MAMPYKKKPQGSGVADMDTERDLVVSRGLSDLEVAVVAMENLIVFCRDIRQR